MPSPVQYDFPWGAEDVESICNRGDEEWRKLVDGVGRDGPVLKVHGVVLIIITVQWSLLEGSQPLYTSVQHWYLTIIMQPAAPNYHS